VHGSPSVQKPKDDPGKKTKTCEDILECVYTLPHVFDGLTSLSCTIRLRTAIGFVSLAIRVFCWGNYLLSPVALLAIFYAASPLPARDVGIFY